MVMGKLKTEVNKQMSILEKSVMRLQDGVDANLKQQNNSSFSNSHVNCMLLKADTRPPSPSALNEDTSGLSEEY